MLSRRLPNRSPALLSEYVQQPHLSHPLPRTSWRGGEQVVGEDGHEVGVAVVRVCQHVHVAAPLQRHQPRALT